MSSAHRPGFPNDQSLAQRQRDAALSRIGRTRRGLIVGAAALTAGFAALVSAIVPGRSLGARAPVTPASGTKVRPASTGSTVAAARMPPLASASQLGLQAPGEAPQSAPSQPSQPAANPPAPAASPSPAAAAPQPASPAPAVVSGGS